VGQRARIAAHIEFKTFRNHDNGPRSISVLGTHKSERRITIDKQPAANSVLVLNDPVSSAVLTNHEQRRSQPRGRFSFFCFFHRRSPLTSFRSSRPRLRDGEWERVCKSPAANCNAASSHATNGLPWFSTSSSKHPARSIVAQPFGALFFLAIPRADRLTRFPHMNIDAN
jgi:hypothetical protein